MEKLVIVFTVNASYHGKKSSPCLLPASSGNAITAFTVHAWNCTGQKNQKKMGLAGKLEEKKQKKQATFYTRKGGEKNQWGGKP